MPRYRWELRAAAAAPTATCRDRETGRWSPAMPYRPRRRRLLQRRRAEAATSPSVRLEGHELLGAATVRCRRWPRDAPTPRAETPPVRRPPARLRRPVL